MCRCWCSRESSSVFRHTLRQNEKFITLNFPELEEERRETKDFILRTLFDLYANARITFGARINASLLHLPQGMAPGLVAIILP